MNEAKYTILLGGIGGDAHSVGLAILRLALIADGYRVNYLGTQNSLEDFFRWAGFSNVVMISSLDGHARYYLRQFPDYKKRYGVKGPLWYLGGNLDIGSGIGFDKGFRDMGFDHVFVKFVDVTTVLESLRKELHSREPVAECTTLWDQSKDSVLSAARSVSDDRLDLELFHTARRQVLDQWPTAVHATDLEDNAAFLSSVPSFHRCQSKVLAGQAPILIQPRSGVPLLEEQIELFKLFKHSGVPVLSYQVDSLTRNNNYAGAAEAIQESRATGISTLNGFPVINHGVPGLRRIAREINLPLQTRHSTRDPRLLAEISYAGGVTSFEGGAICYNIPYYKDYSLDQSIKAWQYVDRLTGIYYERFGIVLDREFFGTLTATLIPPSLAIAVNIIEALLAVRQGVRSVSLGYAEQGHRIQDIAAIRAMRQLASEALSHMGYQEVQINTVFHQYMAAFPEDQERAAQLIYHSAVTAALSGATRIILKTPVEALRIPTRQDNVHGISLVKRGVMAVSEYTTDEIRVAEEVAIIRREVEAILESTIHCGQGDLARGVVSSFQKGHLDIPFSPSIYNRGEVMVGRDIEGAVRFLSLGNLQFDRELRQFHDHKMTERRRLEGLQSAKQDFLLVEEDVLRIARCKYEGWPLFS
jgi:methylaspartate mutase epsilon subunit